MIDGCTYLMGHVAIASTTQTWAASPKSFLPPTDSERNKKLCHVAIGASKSNYSKLSHTYHGSHRYSLLIIMWVQNFKYISGHKWVIFWRLEENRLDLLLKNRWIIRQYVWWIRGFHTNFHSIFHWNMPEF